MDLASDSLRNGSSGKGPSFGVLGSQPPAPGTVPGPQSGSYSGTWGPGGSSGRGAVSPIGWSWLFIRFNSALMARGTARFESPPIEITRPANGIGSEGSWSGAKNVRPPA